MMNAEQLQKLIMSIEEIAKAVESGREFRVIYKPKEFWLNVYSRSCTTTAIHDSKNAADKNASECRIACLHMVEDPSTSEYYGSQQEGNDSDG